jgi:peptidoglycan hydrolase-like protein with peptidoglycan-binding domain
LGDQGDDVKSLQATLNKWYPSLTRLVEDGDFGAKTDERVRYFQTKAKLEVDGIVGSATWSALGYK